MPRISDLGHLPTSSLGKLELDMMGSHQMSEKQVLEAILAEAIGTVFEEYVDKHGLDEIARRLRQGREDRGRRHAAVVAICRAAEARAEGLGQGVRGQPERERSGAGVVRGVRAGGAVRQRSDLAVAEAWADHLRDSLTVFLGIPRQERLQSPCSFSISRLPFCDTIRRE